MEPRARYINQRHVFEIIVLAGVVLFFAYDIFADWRYEDEYGAFHFTLELIVFIGVSVVLVTNLLDLHRLRRQLSREEYRNRLLSRVLVESINDQMDGWRLTRSEREIAWFIIKGYRFSEIAEARGVQESTARLQASSVYAKAGVSGRAEFAAEVFQPLLASIPNGFS